MPLQQSGALTVVYGTQVQDLKRLRRSDMTEADWRVVLKGLSGKNEVRAPSCSSELVVVLCRCCNALGFRRRLISLASR